MRAVYEKMGHRQRNPEGSQRYKAPADHNSVEVDSLRGGRMAVLGIVVAENIEVVGTEGREGQSMEDCRAAVGKLRQVVYVPVEMTHNPHLVNYRTWLVEEDKQKHPVRWCVS
jgi:hypothetical protein